MLHHSQAYLLAAWWGNSPSPLLSQATTVLVPVDNKVPQSTLNPNVLISSCPHATRHAAGASTTMCRLH